ncbi:MFS transporter [Chloroflexota bacterium]
MKKKKVFYGWYIAAASAVLTAVIGGPTAYGFTALVNPLADSLGWSYTQISLAMSLRGIETGVLSPFLGVVVDRWRAKWLIMGGALLVGLGYFCFSRVNSLPMFYVSFAILALGNSLSVMLTPAAAIARWFRKNVGKATGILAMGYGIGGLCTPLIVRMVDNYGWRDTVLLLGVMVTVVGVLISLVFRDRPESYGLAPDGQPLEEANTLAGEVSVPSSPGLGVRAAIKSRAFWHIGISYMLHIGAWSALMIHIMPYLTSPSVGMERTTAGLVAMAVPLVSIVFRLPAGWLADVFDKRLIRAISLVAAAIGLAAFSFVENGSSLLLITAVTFTGIGVSGIIPLRAPLIRQYFGINSFATIFGLQGIFFMAGSVVVPPLVGWVYDTNGTYYPVWLILASACLLSVVVMLTTPRAPELA